MNVAGPIRSRPVPLSDGKRRGGGYADVGVGGSSAGTATDVDMYQDVPSFELSLDEFEEYALARLKVCCYWFAMVWWFFFAYFRCVTNDAPILWCGAPSIFLWCTFDLCHMHHVTKSLPSLHINCTLSKHKYRYYAKLRRWKHATLPPKCSEHNSIPPSKPT